MYMYVVKVYMYMYVYTNVCKYIHKGIKTNMLNIHIRVNKVTCIYIHLHYIDTHKENNVCSYLYNMHRCSKSCYN